MKIYFAPVQGHTDFIYRNAHSKFFNNVCEYYTPFIRKPLRNKDKKDISLKNNTKTNIIPQILGGNKDEMKELLNYVKDLGYKRVDINFGCPFRVITKRGKGSGAFKDIAKMKDLINFLDSFNDLDISLKLRLGYDDPSQILELIPAINNSKIHSICIHSRIGIDEYKGTPDLESFKKVYKICTKPLIYNGDIKTTKEALSIISSFPNLNGIMIGRGLLEDPSLAEKISNKIKDDTTDKQEIENLDLKNEKIRYKNFHNELVEQYSSYLEGGNAQILNKIKTLWEYFLPQTDKKTLKKIKKCSNLRDYRSITSSLFIIK